MRGWFRMEILLHMQSLQSYELFAVSYLTS